MKFNFENFKNKITTNSKAIAIGATAMASLSAVSAGENPETKFTDKIKVEKSTSKNSIADSIDIASYCKTGTTEFINKDMREVAKKAVREFLKDVDFTKYSIEIVGKYSIERPWKGNENLKEERRVLGEQIVREILSEKFSEEDIKKIEINSSAIGQSIYDLGYSKEEIDKMSQSEIESLIDRTQGIDINIVEREGVTKIDQAVEKINQEYKDVYAVVIDQSKSMANEARDVANIVNNVNKLENRDIKTIYLEGGNTEAHIKTLLKILETTPKNVSDTKEILVLTDEPDNSVVSKEEYEELVRRVLDLAIEKNFKIKLKIFNPDQNRGGSKIVNLDENQNVLFLTPEFKKATSPSTFWESKLNQWYSNL